jgi:hypothetical protein
MVVEINMSANISERVQKHRAALRASGMRPIQIWVPDTRAPGFAEECRRQSLLSAASDSNDKDLMTLMDEALADVDGWKA